MQLYIVVFVVHVGVADVIMKFILFNLSTLGYKYFIKRKKLKWPKKYVSSKRSKMQDRDTEAIYLYLWIKALNASPSLQLVVKFLTSTPS